MDSISLILTSLIQGFSNHEIEILDQKRDERLMLFLFTRNKVKEELSNFLMKVLKKKSQITKSCKKSEELRNYGNMEFKKLRYKSGLRLYNESITIAPPKSAELSLALGNRSAVLFRMAFYEECISDIDFALQNFENLTVYPKLMLRKINSLCKINRVVEAAKCFEVLKTFTLSNHNIDPEQICNVIKSYQYEFDSYRNATKLETEGNRSSIPQVIDEENESFPFASNVLELRSSLENLDRNRKVITRQTIEAGDIIFVEQPFSSVVLPEFCDSHCQLCCKLLIAPVACSTCIESLYCNQECQKQAYNLFHRWECKGLEMLQNLGVGHLAFRTMLISTKKSDSSLCNQIENLETHLNDVSINDLLQYALTAALLATYLEEHTNYLIEYPSFMKEKIAFSILQHIIRVICNAFTIKKSSDEESQPKLLNLSLVSYATGMFPSAAMMNHSCLPNIVTSFHFNSLVVRASKQITKGEEVLNCYGPHAKKMKTLERRKLLKDQFFFDCHCDACVPNVGFVDETDAFICKNCKFPFTSEKLPKSTFCKNCKGNIDQNWYENLMKKTATWRKIGTEYMSNENFKCALDIFKKTDKLFLLFMHKNNLEVFCNALDISDCYCALGKYDKGWNCLKKCIEMSDKIFDTHSTDYANLVIKTLDVFQLSRNGFDRKTNSSNIDTMLKYFDKITFAIELNFGAWSKQYQLTQMKKQEIINALNS